MNWVFALGFSNVLNLSIGYPAIVSARSKSITNVQRERHLNIFLCYRLSKLNMAQSTSKKHADFMSEPMANKSVLLVPGIGPVGSQKLKNEGIVDVSILQQPRKPLILFCNNCASYFILKDASITFYQQ